MKFIIDLEPLPTEEGLFNEEDTLYRAKGFRTLVFDQYGIQKLEPYALTNSLIAEARESSSASAWTLMQRILNPDAPEGIKLSTLKEALGITNDNVTVADILTNYAYSDVYRALTTYTDTIQNAIKVVKSSGWLEKHDQKVREDDRLDRVLFKDQEPL